MYEIGQLLVYGSSGVCRVEALEHPDFAPPEMKDRLYYRLKPVYEPGRLYVPADTAALRPVVSRAEAEALLRALPGLEPRPCESHSPQILTEHYKGFFRTHRCEDLLQLLKTLHRKTAASAKKLSKVDRIYQKKAEEQLCREFALALDCTPDEVQTLLQNALRGAQG